MQSIHEVRKACQGRLQPVRVAYVETGHEPKLGYLTDISTSMVWVKWDEDLAQTGSWAKTQARGLTPQQIRLAPEGS